MESEELDLSGLVESIVDSDEDDSCEGHESFLVRDKVRECLEKDPSDRTEDDIEVLLDFVQHLKAFTNMTYPVKRALCSVMVFAVVEEAGTVVMNDGEELDSWSVLINGRVEIEHQDGRKEHLHLGDSFGILPTMEKLYHDGVMRTTCDDCQFVCITQSDYFRIQHQGEENIKRHENTEGQVVMVTERRGVETGQQGYVVIRALPECLVSNLIEYNPIVDPTYVEDFLLTFRTFIKDPLCLVNQLLKWFSQSESELKEHVAQIVLCWVSNHFIDFETSSIMMEFLEHFQMCLETEGLVNHLHLLNTACVIKSQTRYLTLTRPDRDFPLSFQIIGGHEYGCGIYISMVENGSKAAEIGLKRGDQILTVNGHNFSHVTYGRAVEILCGSTHLGITVKANLPALKDALYTISNQSPCRSGRAKQEYKTNYVKATCAVDGAFNPPPVSLKPPNKYGGAGGFCAKKKFHRALMKMNMLAKYSLANYSGSSQADILQSPYHANATYPSNVSFSFVCHGDIPEHVLKVYKPDQTYKYLLVHKETTAHEVVMLALQEFGITEPSSQFCLCEVTVAEGNIIKQKRLPDQMQNLYDRIDLSGRYYLKTSGSTETLVSDELAAEISKESIVHFLQLDAAELAVQLTLMDFDVFRRIRSTEYIDDLFSPEDTGVTTGALHNFSELVNREMFWVVTEVCSESNLVKRSKIIKQFVKIACHCKELKNFNSMFAIVSGLGHGAVSRLSQSWEKLPKKYQKLFEDLQDLMDPSRNMSKYRQLVSSEQHNPPVIPFYPVVRKDLTFIHLGNDNVVEGLVNFEKLRMIAKEVRNLVCMCSAMYDSCNNADHNATTSFVGNSVPPAAKSKKKQSNVLNPRKMYEESIMMRKVRAYLSKLKVIQNEDRLHELSHLCESGSISSAPGSGQLRKRNPSPTFSTASIASSNSDGRKSNCTKFGSASPQAVRKLLSLSEQSKTRPYNPKHFTASCGSHINLPDIGFQMATTHERSNSDTVGLYGGPLIPVNLSAESSSVTSLSNRFPRKVSSVDERQNCALYYNASPEIGASGRVQKTHSCEQIGNSYFGTTDEYS